MATYKGKDSWLVFRCKHCYRCFGYSTVTGSHSSSHLNLYIDMPEIMIDPTNRKDLVIIGEWFKTHSNNGGWYETVEKKDFGPDKKGKRKEGLLVLYNEMEERHRNQRKSRKK